MADPGSVRAGKAHVEVDGDTGKLKRKLAGIGPMFKRMGATASRAFAVVGKAAAVGTAAVSAIGAVALKAARDFSEMGDKFHKAALRTRISAESLSQLKFAAEQSGTSFESLSAAMIRSQRRISNAAAAGRGPAAVMLKALKMDLKELAAMDPEAQFFAIVDAMNAINDPALAAQAGFEIFGDNVRDLLPMIRGGTAEIRRLMVEAHNLGATITTEQAEQAAAQADAMNRMSTSIKGAWMEIGSVISPIITSLADGITGMAAEVNKFLEASEAVQSLWVTDFTGQMKAAIDALVVRFKLLGDWMVTFLDAIGAVELAVFQGRWGDISDEWNAAFDRGEDRRAFIRDQFERDLANRHRQRNMNGGSDTGTKEPIPTTTAGAGDYGEAEPVSSYVGGFNLESRNLGQSVNETLSSLARQQLAAQNQTNALLADALDAGAL